MRRVFEHSWPEVDVLKSWPRSRALPAGHLRTALPCRAFLTPRPLKGPDCKRVVASVLKPILRLRPNRYQGTF